MNERLRVDPRRRKLTLFCQRCDHASPIERGWRTETTPSGAVRYCCPDCDHVVLVQPPADREPPDPKRRT